MCTYFLSMYKSKIIQMVYIDYFILTNNNRVDQGRAEGPFFESRATN